MNIKLTKKDIKINFSNIIETGYCDLWYLLRGLNRLGYNSGVYGWNWDAYKLNQNTVIITGYRPFGAINPSFDIIHKYNELAKKSKNKDLPKLREQFLREVLKQ